MRVASPIIVAITALTLLLPAPLSAQPAESKPVAAVVSTYYHNSHADVIVSRLLQGYTLENKPPYPKLKLVSLYTDQVPQNDISRRLAAEHKVPIYNSVAESLTLGMGKLAVEGVLLVAEHGNYPRSETSQIVYPKRRLFEQVVKVFEQSGRVVPVFIDKHLADNWEDAMWIYQTAQRMKIPLMAGSSLPTLWRYPPMDVPKDAKLQEIVAISYHTLDAYGFHGLEMLETIAERRQGGETGIRAVQCLTGEAVWQAGEKGLFDVELLRASLARLTRPVEYDEAMRKRVKEPVLFLVEYSDGLKASMLTLNGAVGEWCIAWRYDDSRLESTRFHTQEARPFQHFAYLLGGVEKMMHTGQPAWPVERTLLTSGLLDACLVSKLQGGKRLETPHLNFSYEQPWSWQPPPPAPPDRPISGQ